MVVKKFYFCLLLAFFLFSLFDCGLTPPKNLYVNDLLDSAQELTDDIVSLLNNFSVFNFLHADWIPQVGHFALYKDNFFTFTQYPYEFEPTQESDYIFYSYENGSIISGMDIFLLKDKKNNLFYSFDKENWFAIDGDPRQYENFYPIVDVKYTRSKTHIDYEFSWAVKPGSNPKRVSIKNLSNIKVMPLSSKTVITDTKNLSAQSDLINNMLHLPKGTIIDIDVTIFSNFLSFQKTEQNSATFFAIESTHLYKKGWMLSISFDGSYWGDNLFSFNFDLQTTIKAKSDNRLNYCLSGYLFNKNLYKRQMKKGVVLPFNFNPYS